MYRKFAASIGKRAMDRGDDAIIWRDKSKGPRPRFSHMGGGGVVASRRWERPTLTSCILLTTRFPTLRAL